MLHKRYDKRVIQCCFCNYLQHYYDVWGTTPNFYVEDIEYFTVDERDDGLTEIIFYNNKDEVLFSDLD